MGESLNQVLVDKPCVEHRHRYKCTEFAGYGWYCLHGKGDMRKYLHRMIENGTLAKDDDRVYEIALLGRELHYFSEDEGYTIDDYIVYLARYSCGLYSMETYKPYIDWQERLMKYLLLKNMAFIDVSSVPNAVVEQINRLNPGDVKYLCEGPAGKDYVWKEFEIGIIRFKKLYEGKLYEFLVKVENSLGSTVVDGMGRMDGVDFPVKTLLINGICEGAKTYMVVDEKIIGRYGLKTLIDALIEVWKISGLAEDEFIDRVRVISGLELDWFNQGLYRLSTEMLWI